MNYHPEPPPPLFAQSQGIRPGSFSAAKLAEVLEVKVHPSHPVPPCQPHSPTSRAAATALPNADTLRSAVLDAIKAHGGLTDEEVQDTLVMQGSTQRPRRIELVAAGLVVDSGRTRATRSGRQAVVWEAKS